jgi:murein DD-endopeptidase MepM/ murein hydrolase activator NlpD
MSYALYEASGGRLTTPFDGYESTPGRHEGIDFARSAGSGVYALVSGRVINVVEGGDGLSTIAIYNDTLNKTVIYLHTNPSVRENARVNRGDLIATEASRGASSAHTHVEMRPGSKTNAAKSVGDPVLDNPDPTSFWNSQGYDER